MGIVNGGLAARELAEQASQAVHAYRHADSPPGAGGAGSGCGVLDFERVEAASREQARGVKVIRQAAETRFPGREEIVDKSAVWACSGHNGEVTDSVAISEFADWDQVRCALDLLECGFQGIE